MDQPSIFRKDLWAQQQERLIGLFIFALSLLEREGPLPELEEDITRRFAICCCTAKFLLDKQGNRLIGSLHWETKDLEHYKDIRIPVNEVKKPDCQYAFHDQQASKVEDYEKSLTIECKRLGRFPDSSHTRKLNQKYVLEGICRFLNESHCYGKSAPGGIMIGYVQNMELDDILAAVNAECTSQQITELILSTQGWQPGLISHLDHRLDRAFPITPFILRHIWADLRRHYGGQPN